MEHEDDSIKAIIEEAKLKAQINPERDVS